jgi:DNA-binding MarR family transcriptional regulator
MPPQPLSAYINASFVELRPVLEQTRPAASDRPMAEAVGGLILHRTLKLLRDSSRDDILTEGIALDGFLTSPAGDQFRTTHPDLYFAWQGVSALLGEAARRSDRAAIESILRSHDGHGRAVLELLAERAEPVRRADVRERLQLSESHMSHVLRDLEEADLIERRPSGREVALALGPVGREVVARHVLPEWVRHLVDVLQRARHAQADLPQAEALADELSRKGAPSRLVSRQLAEAIAAARGWTITAENNAKELTRAATDPVQQADLKQSKVRRFSPRAAAA